MAGLKGINQKKRNKLYELSQQFQDIAGGIYPLSIPEDDLDRINFEKENENAIIRMQVTVIYFNTHN